MSSFLPSATLLLFWRSHPALLFGVIFLLGAFASLVGITQVLAPLFFLLLPFFFPLKQLFSTKKTEKNETAYAPLFLPLLVSVFAAAYFYTSAFAPQPVLPEGGIKGVAKTAIDALALRPTPFGKSWVYACTLKQFTPFKNKRELSAFPLARSIPCSILLPAAGPEDFLQRPKANGDYWIEGRLSQNQEGRYVFKPSPKVPWVAIEGTQSLAERRFEWKMAVSEWIATKYPHPGASIFLSGLITGQFDDFWMKQQLGRFGLQHLLAISGFHFSALAAFFSFILLFFMPRALRSIALLFLLGLYSLFLGFQPSIIRAWLMSSLAIFGALIDKEAKALNLLGAALLFSLLYQPHFALELGFQLSFLITAAILLLYPLALSFCQQLIPQRTLKQALRMNRLNQHAYCLLALFVRGLALSLAINLAALPIVLYYFHQFPWMSLLYNLFFPLLVSLSLWLFLFGVLFAWLPPLGTLIHHFNDAYTVYVLNLTYRTPVEIDLFLTTHSIPLFPLIVYLTLLFSAAILAQKGSSISGSDNSASFF